MTYSFNHHEILTYAAIFADAAEIVAREVDEHDVFGAFLGISQQIFLVLQILRVRVAARTRAGDGRIQLRISSQRTYRRGTNKRKALQLQEEHGW